MRGPSVPAMTAPAPYLHLPGTARKALAFYRDVFGGEAEVHTLADFGRTDGPPDAVAHGELRGPVTLFAADASGDEAPLRVEGLTLSLLGAAEPAVLHTWFAALAEGGQVLDDLQRREWGAADGTVVDRFGVRWLLGYED